MVDEKGGHRRCVIRNREWVCVCVCDPTRYMRVEMERNGRPGNHLPYLTYLLRVSASATAGGDSTVSDGEGGSREQSRKIIWHCDALSEEGRVSRNGSLYGLIDWVMYRLSPCSFSAAVHQ